MAAAKSRKRRKSHPPSPPAGTAPEVDTPISDPSLIERATREFLARDEQLVQASKRQGTQRKKTRGPRKR
jgi:hypothetical protein